MRLILATRNESKAVQIKQVLEALPIEVLTMSDLQIEGEAVEDGSTLEENAYKKANYVWERGHILDWVMADDTGLYIDALDGEPGIYAARWAGEDAQTDDITRYTLEKLDGVAEEERTATFKTVAVLIAPDGTRHAFEGSVRGVILTAPRTKPQPKMPYSPIFLPDGERMVWAEMTTEHENSVSHRGKAFRKLRSFIEEKLHASAS